jgi:hypothetical protein
MNMSGYMAGAAAMALNYGGLVLHKDELGGQAEDTCRRYCRACR